MRHHAASSPHPTPTHRTAGGVLVVAGQLLLEKRGPEARVYANFWDVPGGHIEDGEDPDLALKREMREELGIEIDHSFLGMVLDDSAQRRTDHRTYRHYIYVVHQFRGTPSACEEQDLKWWPMDTAIDNVELNPVTAYALRHFVEAGWI